MPLRCAGEHAGHLFAFARVKAGSSAMVVVPRLLTALAWDLSPPLGEAVWHDTVVLFDGLNSTPGWRNAFTGGRLMASRCDGQSALKAAEVFGHFPVALLIAEECARK